MSLCRVVFQLNVNSIDHADTPSAKSKCWFSLSLLLQCFEIVLPTCCSEVYLESSLKCQRLLLTITLRFIKVNICNGPCAMSCCHSKCWWYRSSPECSSAAPSAGKEWEEYVQIRGLVDKICKKQKGQCTCMQLSTHSHKSDYKPFRVRRSHAKIQLHLCVCVCVSRHVDGVWRQQRGLLSRLVVLGSWQRGVLWQLHSGELWGWGLRLEGHQRHQGELKGRRSSSCHNPVGSKGTSVLTAASNQHQCIWVKGTKMQNMQLW